MDSRGIERWQWAMLVKVLHGPKFGHRIEIQLRSKARETLTLDGGTWTGLGVPDDVLVCIRAQLDAILTDHLVTRYGIREELPLKWSGEPDPF